MYVGMHENILRPMGIVEWKKCVCFVSMFQGNISLQMYLESRPTCICPEIMHVIGNGRGFLHTKSVIHYGLTTDNIILNNIGGGTYLPVIGGFSKAYRANAADLYMCGNETKFPVHHLPIDIQLGKRLPDFRSDLHSIGLLFRCLFQHCKEDFFSKYCHLSSMCIREEMYTSEFLEHIMDLCSGCVYR